MPLFVAYALAYRAQMQSHCARLSQSHLNPSPGTGLASVICCCCSALQRSRHVQLISCYKRRAMGRCCMADLLVAKWMADQAECRGPSVAKSTATQQTHISCAIDLVNKFSRTRPLRGSSHASDLLPGLHGTNVH